MQQIYSLKSSAVITFMKDTFARHGIPEKIRSDDGPQFKLIKDSSFNKFIKEYGIEHITSSPYFAQSNGMAEAAVKIAKKQYQFRKRSLLINLLHYCVVLVRPNYYLVGKFEQLFRR